MAQQRTVWNGFDTCSWWMLHRTVNCHFKSLKGSPRHNGFQWWLVGWLDLRFEPGKMWQTFQSHEQNLGGGIYGLQQPDVSSWIILVYIYIYNPIVYTSEDFFNVKLGRQSVLTNHQFWGSPWNIRADMVGSNLQTKRVLLGHLWVSKLVSRYPDITTRYFTMWI